MSQDEPTNIAEIRRRLLDDYKEKAKSGAMFRFLPCLIARTRKARDGLDGPCDITAAGLTERKRPRKISLVFFL